MSPTTPDLDHPQAEAIRFQVSTRRTGRLRIVKVEILPDEATFQRRYRALGLAAALLVDVPDDYRVDGACIPRRTWEDRDPRPHQVTLLFLGEQITASLIAHEATHAAAHLYSIDRYRDHARASAHLHIGNEPLAYLVADIFSEVARKTQEAGINLVVGYSKAQRDPNGAA